MNEVRRFDTGATRSSEAGRYDPEGFMSPIVVERFCEYMNKHRVQPDGSIRDSDNWQKGIPLATYIKGMWRHFLHLWARHRGVTPTDKMAAADIEEDLCALLFNVQGYLFEVLKKRTEEAKCVPLDDEWLLWTGGTCPVDGETIVEVVLRDGVRLTPRKASHLDWQNNSQYCNGEADIVKYLIVK